MSAAAPGALSPETVAALRHDLRTPVNHIVGYCELLLEDAGDDAMAPRRAALEAALATVREVLTMINTALPPSGAGITQGDVDALYARLRGPHARILEAMATLSTPAAQTADPEFAADVGKIREATEQLVSPRRPMAGAATATAPMPAARARAVRVSPAGTARGRILVADDVEDNRQVLMRHLARQGYTAESASDGEQALEMIRHAAYDLLLLDVRMPRVSGDEVLARLKHDPATHDLPGVMISASDDLATIAACIEAGAEDFLPKPFDPVILHARISASIEKKRLRDQEVDYLRQVDAMAEAAAAVERGNYVAGSLAAVARRDDAVGRLARVFDSMAAGVRAREDRLHQQLQTLQQEITQAQRAAASDIVADAGAGMLIPGEWFAGRYQITRVVGRGGMGTVYKATDRDLAEEIAIKLIRLEAMAGDPSMNERLKSEIRLARRISHRNVVRTHDFGEWQGTSYVTMEYVEGITLRDLIDTRKRLEASSTIGLARQLAAALAVAHEEGVIHRDIKPQNLLLDAAGVLKVMDFGIARLAERQGTLTQAGMVVGTPAYMAPEQLLDEAVDARSDLYAAGVVLYECLTGSLPFSAASPIALIAKVLNTTPAPPGDLAPDVPGPLSSLVMRLIAKDPAERPRSAGELGELLAQLE